MPTVAVKYKEVEGRKIVVGFGSPVLDPEATKARAKSIVSTSPEARRVLSLLRDLRTSGKLRPDDLAILDEARTVLSSMLNAEARSRPVYFDTIPNEINLPSEVACDLQALFHRRPPHTALLLDGTLILDNRGREFWFRHSTEGLWVSGRVEKVGEGKPDFSVWADELCPSDAAEIQQQQEADRLANLTAEQRAAEKAQALAGAKRAAASMRSDLEIEGNPRALETARRWYQQEVRGIEEKYR